MRLAVQQVPLVHSGEEGAYVVDLPYATAPTVLDFCELAPGKSAQVWLAVFSDNDETEDTSDEGS